MTHKHWIAELKKRLGSETWAWALRALQQEELVWSTLSGKTNGVPFGEKALQTLPDQPESWSPASLALLALGQPELTQKLTDPVWFEIPPELRAQATEAYREWISKPPAMPESLAQAGLLALSVRERRRLKGTWQGLSLFLEPWGPAAGPVVACLAGMIPQPVEMLANLLPNCRRLALHALLSQPLPPDRQAAYLDNLLTWLSKEAQMALLEDLARLRPAAATQLALAHSDPIDPASPAAPSDEVHIDRAHPLAAALTSLPVAQTHILAGQTEPAVPLLATALEQATVWHSHLAVQLALAAERTGSPATVCLAWQRAAHLAPDRPDYLAGLVIALVKAGRSDEAQAHLDACLPHLAEQPAMRLAEAFLAQAQNDVEQARQLASAALPWKTNVRADADANRWLLELLTQLLLDTGASELAAQAAHQGLECCPGSPKFLVLHALALLNTPVQADSSSGVDAIAAAYAALTGEPIAGDAAYTQQLFAVRRGLAAALEAAGDWEAALSERQVVVGGAPEGGSEPGKNRPLAADLHALANCALHAGQPKVAAKAAEQALEQSEEDGEAHALLGQASLTLQDWATAAQQFRKALRLAPQNAPCWLGLAQAYQKGGLPERGLEALRTACQAAPGEASLQLALGSAYLSATSPSQALPYLRRAAELSTQPESPDNRLSGEAFLKLGKTLHRLGHVADACQALAEGHQHHPEDSTIRYDYAKMLLESGCPENARTIIEPLVASQPDNPQIHLDFARAVLKSSQSAADAGRAAEALRRSLELTSPRLLVHCPSDVRTIATNQTAAEALGLLAEALTRTGDLETAEDTFRKALETPLADDLEWRAELFLGLGNVCLMQNCLENAIEALQEAAQAAPQNASIQRSLSEAYLIIGQESDAFRAARAVLSLSNKLSDLEWFAHQALKLHAEAEGGHPPAQAAAIEALQRAVDLAPERVDLLLELGQAQMQAGEKAEARKCFARLADSAPAPASSLLLAAHSLRALEDPAQAAGLLKKAFAKMNTGALQEKRANTPDPLRLQFELVAAYNAAQATPEALQAAEEGLALAPQDPGLSLLKARLLIQMERSDEALECLEAAVAAARAVAAASATAAAAPTHATEPHWLAALYYQTACLLREQGRPASALDQADLALETLRQNPAQSDATLRPIVTALASLLAASLARDLLQPDRARGYLTGLMLPAPVPSDDLDADAPDSDPLEGGIWRTDFLPAIDLFELACTQAELAFEHRKPQETQPDLTAAVNRAIRFDPQHPRSLALQIRLVNYRQNMEAGLEAWHRNWEPLTSRLPSPAQASDLSMWCAAAQAVLEIDQWEAAQNLIQKALSQAAHPTPWARLLLAQAIVLRAEAERRCQILDIRKHAPGLAALNTDARAAFEEALQTCRDLLPNLSDLALTQAADEAARALDYWQRRGAAAFEPSPTSAMALEQALQERAAAPLDSAALLQAHLLAGQTERLAQLAQGAWVHVRQGIYLALALAGQNPSRALAIAQQALRMAAGQSNSPVSDLPGLNALFARLLFELEQDRTAALPYIQSALAAWPDEPRWHALAGRIYLAGEPQAGSSDLQAALAHLEQAISLEPGQPEPYLDRARALRLNGQDETARETLERAAELAPETPAAWLNLAEIQRDMEDLEGAALSAERAAQCAVEKSIDPAPALLLQGEIALQTNNPRGAIARAQAVLRQHPADMASLLLLGHALEDLNRPGDALAAVEKAISLAEDELPLQRERARLLRVAHKPEKALPALQDLAERFPQEPDFLALLAETLLESGQSIGAVQAAQRALQAGAEELPDEKKANLHLLIARQMRQAGQLDGAVHHLSEALLYTPDSLEVHLELGKAYQSRRQFTQAQKVYQEAIQLAPDDYRPYFQAGQALKESKEYLEAEVMLRRAAQLAPNELSVHRLLGAIVALNLVHNRRTVSAEG